MKKIYALLLMIAVAFTLSACGPNSDYFNLGSKRFYYYNDEPLVVDPYELFKEDTDWLDISMSRSRKPEKYYDVKVEWRLNDSHDSFKELETVDNMIKFDNPYQNFGTSKSYDFKLHFIAKDDTNEENWINYYGVLTFIKSPANADKKELTKAIGDTYTLLNNVIEYNLEDKPMSPSEFEDIYDVVYTVTSAGEDYSDDVDDDGKYTFNTAGDYIINIELTKKAAETDAVSGASESGGESEKMVLNIDYIVHVPEATE